MRPNQIRALEVLTTTGSVNQAAEAAQVTRQTIFRWMRDDEFSKAISDAESQALEALSRALLNMATLATDTLKAAMQDATAPQATKIRAAEVVLDRLENLRQLAQFDRRLTELEKELNYGKK